MTDTDTVDERARLMSDDERDAYLTSHGWMSTPMGRFAPGSTEMQTLCQTSWAGTTTAANLRDLRIGQRW